MSYSEYFEARMKELGLNKKQLAEAAGLPYMTVSGILKNGAERAGLQNVLSICRVLRIDPSALFGEDTAPADDYIWALPLCKAYQASPEPTQRNVCKLLDIKHVQAPKPAPSAATDEPVDETDIGYDTIAAHADGLDKDDALAEIDAAVAAIRKKYSRKK